jgi:hypothetical protein
MGNINNEGKIQHFWTLWKRSLKCHIWLYWRFMEAFSALNIRCIWAESGFFFVVNCLSLGDKKKRKGGPGVWPV